MHKMYPILLKNALYLIWVNARDVIPKCAVKIGPTELGRNAHMIAKTLPSASAASRTRSPTSSLMFLIGSLPASKSHWPANRCKNAPSTPCNAIQWKWRVTVLGWREEKRNICSSSLFLRPGAGYSSDGEYSDISGHRSVLGCPPFGIVLSNQCSHPWWLG